MLDRIIQVAEEHQLWPDLIPVIAELSPATQQRLLELPVLQQQPDILGHIITAADQHGLWSRLLPLVGMMEPALLRQVGKQAALLDRQAIGRALDQKASLVRLPGDRSASLRAALRAVSGNGDELDEEHARLHRLTTPTSLDRTIGDDDSNELVDLLPDATPGPEAEVMDRAENERAMGLLDVLDSRARYAVEQRFGLHDGRKRSYREVGEELGVTAEAARRLVKRAVNTVRDRASEVANDAA